MLYGGSNQNLQGHFSGNISSNRYDIYPIGSYAVGDYWHKVSYVIDNGTWSLGSQVYQNTVYTGTIPCCSCTTGYVTGGNLCSPANNGYGCYRTDLNYYGLNCRFDIGCCLCGCGCVAEDCYYDVYYYFYDNWNPNWSTGYSIMKWQYGQWVQVGSYIVNTGGTPVFV